MSKCKYCGKNHSITAPTQKCYADQITKLQVENKRLLDTCLAAGFIGKGTQIIGDRRYEELLTCEKRVEQYKAELEWIDSHLFEEVDIQATREFIKEDTPEARRLLRLCDLIEKGGE